MEKENCIDKVLTALKLENFNGTVTTCWKTSHRDTLYSSRKYRLIYKIWG